MKQFIITIFCLVAFCNCFAQNNVDENLRKQFEKCYFTDSCNTILPYRLLRPLNIDTLKQYPVVLFLHGAGERGNDNEINLTHIDKIFGSEDFRKNYPCYVIIPQCAENFRWCETDWTLPSHTMPNNISVYLNAANQLLDSLVIAVNADTNRLYITGLSMGGFGTWDIISRFPKKFAAALPICGGADLNKACSLINIPIKTFHGSADKVVKVIRTRNIVNAIRKCGGKNITYIEYPGKGHFVWTPAYSDPETFKWLFSQKKLNK
ncbi:MAG: phospholipase [Bacteroidales bacterium]|nr:phospholipase [Bacteroidales bacterium]